MRFGITLDVILNEYFVQLWETLRPGHKLENRLTNEWQLIGFQATDPSTDFRGTGYLGLQQLITLCFKESSHHKEAMLMYKDSTVEEHWYFFACAGINLTQKLLRSIQKGEFDKCLLFVIENYGDDQAKIRDLFDEWYYRAFKSFNEQWRDAKVGIMEFNHFFERVYDMYFLPDHQKIAEQFYGPLGKEKRD